MTERFAADWLALREPFDRAARSVRLADRFAVRLPERPQVIDLGAGTGSMFRFLAPMIGRRQDWILVDADAVLLDDAFGRTAAWARQRGLAASAAGDELRIATPQGLWRMQAVVRDLATTQVAIDADGVVCGALFDLVSREWLSRLFDRLSVPLLACLTVDGRDLWLPRHPLDARIRAAFGQNQSRDKGFGRALGSSAPSFALCALAARGFATASAPTDWRIARTALAMQRALIEGIGAAEPAWQQARLRQALRGRLAIRIGHRDILAVPRGG